MELDKTLRSFQVYRQAYYSGTFVGNHVHKSLKVSADLSIFWLLLWIPPSQETNITTLCQSIVSLAQRVCPAFVPEATLLRDKFKKLFQLFACCHNIYDKNYVTDSEVTSLGML